MLTRSLFAATDLSLIGQILPPHATKFFFSRSLLLWVLGVGAIASILLGGGNVVPKMWCPTLC
jgi:hypothetical protein